MLHLPEFISRILTFKDDAALRMKKIMSKKQCLQKQLQQMIQDPPSFRASPYRLTNKTMIQTIKPVDQKLIQRFVGRQHPRENSEVHLCIRKFAFHDSEI
jgi:hypothetical protein